jgi:hypothetical protein
MHRLLNTRDHPIFAQNQCSMQVPMGTSHAGLYPTLVLILPTHAQNSGGHKGTIARTKAHTPHHCISHPPRIYINHVMHTLPWRTRNGKPDDLLVLNLVLSFGRLTRSSCRKCLRGKRVQELYGCVLTQYCIRQSEFFLLLQSLDDDRESLARLLLHRPCKGAFTLYEAFAMIKR